jgi:hypothetical protein
MSTLEPHHLADLFPPMEGAEYAALREDIRVNGLFDPITLYQGRILDGRKLNITAGCSGFETSLFTPAAVVDLARPAAGASA